MGTKEGAYDSRAIANIFVDLAKEAGDRLSIVPLLRYVYLAHGWTLGIKGVPLIRHHVEAWKYGPVIPEVYEAFRPQGLYISEHAKGRKGEELSADIDPADVRALIIRNTYSAYSRKSSFDFAYLTLGKDTPWFGCIGRLYSRIEDSDIRDHYRRLLCKLGRKAGDPGRAGSAGS